MRKVLLNIFCIIIFSNIINAQSPQSINYQAVVRNTSGDVIKNQNVRFRLSITEGTNGFTVYTETHQATTNLLGLVNLSIGGGTPVVGSFSNINWANNTKSLKVEVDITGGTNYVLMGSQQLVSVPYSLYADKAGSIPNQWQFNNNGIHYNLGKVGIGTNIPNYKLSLLGDESGVQPNGTPDGRCFLNIKNTATGQYSVAYTQIASGASNALTSLSQHGSNYYFNELADFGQLWSTGKGLVLRASPASSSDPDLGVIKFLTGYRMDGGSNERMRIDSKGNIGIGTSTPNYKLSLEGDEAAEGRCFINVRNTTSSIDGVAYARFYSGGNTFTTIGHHNPNYFYPQHADYGQVWSTGKGLILRASASSATDPNIGVIKFMTGYKDGGTSFERVRIDVDGNVGIGTETPKAKLEVTAGDVYVNDATKGIILKSPNGGCWRVTIDNTGNFVRTAIACPN